VIKRWILEWSAALLLPLFVNYSNRGPTWSNDTAHGR
jgi:hypothetical protein